MYKILIKYVSTLKQTFWQSYEVEQEDGNSVEFSTDNIDVLKDEIKKLDKEYGFEKIRVVKDVTYSILVDMSGSINLEDAEIATTDDVNNVFNAAFDKVFGGE